MNTPPLTPTVAHPTSNDAPASSSSPAPRRPCPFPPRNEPMIWGKGRFKVDVLLRDADRTAYDEVLSNPRTSARGAWAWLTARGYKIGQNAVANHKRQFDRDNEQLRRAARSAAAYASAAESLGGPEAFSTAALTKINELAMAHLFPAGEPGAGAAVTTAVLNELARTIDKALAARDRLEALRPKLAAARRAAEPRAEPDHLAVVNRVCEILGMPPVKADGRHGDTRDNSDAGRHAG